MKTGACDLYDLIDVHVGCIFSSVHLFPPSFFCTLSILLCSRDGGPLGPNDIRRGAGTGTGRRKPAPEPVVPGFRPGRGGGRSGNSTSSSDSGGFGGSARNNNDDRDNSGGSDRQIKSFSDSDLDGAIAQMKRGPQFASMRERIQSASQGEQSAYEDAWSGSTRDASNSVDEERPRGGTAGRAARGGGRGSTRGGRGGKGWVDDATRVQRFLARPGAQLPSNGAGQSKTERYNSEPGSERSDDRGRGGRGGSKVAARGRGEGSDGARGGRGRGEGRESDRGTRGGRQSDRGGMRGGLSSGSGRAPRADAGTSEGAMRVAASPWGAGPGEFRGGTRGGMSSRARVGAGTSHRTYDGTVPIYNRNFQDLNSETVRPFPPVPMQLHTYGCDNSGCATIQTNVWHGRMPDIAEPRHNRFSRQRACLHF